MNDAFATLHRTDASIAQLPTFFEPTQRTFGLLVEKELSELSHIFDSPKHPVCLILGGGKGMGKLELLSSLLDVVDVSASDFFLAQGLFSFLVLTALRKGDSLEDIKKDLVELGALQEPAPGEPESRSERFGELLSKFEPRLPELDASARRERAARRVVPTLSGVDYQTNLSLDVKDRFDVWSQTKAGYSPKFDDFTPVCLCSFALSDDEVFHFQVATDRLKRVLDILQAAMTELEKAEELAAQLRGKE